MNGKIYLVDANIFIQPHQKFYPFDFAPSYWEFLSTHIKNGDIGLLSLVYDEVLKGGDDLSDWLKDLGCNKIDHRAPEIWSIYGQVLTHVQNATSVTGTKLYKQSALDEWAKNDIADPWLVATAKAKNYDLVTMEISNGSLGTNSAKYAKIPDVARAFHVECGGLFEMMRALGFIFK